MRRDPLLSTGWLLLPLAGLLAAGCSGTPAHSSRATAATEQTSDRGDLPRDRLTSATDLATCRIVLRAQTAAQSRPGAPHPPALDEAFRAFLKDPKRANLESDELNELEGGSYTPLDEHYLDACLLFRDAARSLEVDDQPLREKARTAFAWVSRQLRIADQPSDTIPAEFALRRGWGTPMDRSFAFLALMRQLGVEGCMVSYSAPGREKEFYRVCGIPTEDGKDLYLFDPHLGLPLPGPEGQGIATLGSVKKQQHLLQHFPVDSRFNYNSTPAKINLVSPLSSMAPRMKFLQDDVLGTAVRVQLAVDPRALYQRYAAIAAAQALPDDTVEFWREAAVLLRYFLTPDEGGVDRGGIPLSVPALAGYVSAEEARDPAIVVNHRQYYYLGLVPWRLMPPGLRNLQYRTEVGQRPRSFLVARCAAFYTEPNTPRDYILRGRFAEAAATLTTLREQLKDQRERYLREADLNKRLDEWATQANNAYLAVRRAENAAGASGGGDVDAAKVYLERSLKEGEKLWGPALEGITADVRMREVEFQLGLCMQEQAERRQDRVRRPGATDAERQAAQEAWTTAASWWDTFASEFPVPPEGYPNLPAAPVARRPRALSHLALGETRQAVSLLEDTAGVPNPLEVVARQYLARQQKH